MENEINFLLRLQIVIAPMYCCCYGRKLSICLNRHALTARAGFDFKAPAPAARSDNKVLRHKFQFAYFHLLDLFDDTNFAIKRCCTYD